MDTILSITGVNSFEGFEGACVAQKMSWAAKRQTTRVEDQAYCLMGLFGVNMPPLYGEGDRAFYRLQLEILKDSDDESIFAWTDKELWKDYGGMLASSPEAFSNCGRVYRGHFDRPRPPFTMTNKGLRIELHLIPGGLVPCHFIAPLNCTDGRDGKPIQIALRRVYRNQFLMVPSKSHLVLDFKDEAYEYNREQRTLVHIKPRAATTVPLSENCAFIIRPGNLSEHGFVVSRSPCILRRRRAYRRKYSRRMD